MQAREFVALNRERAKALDERDRLNRTLPDRGLVCPVVSSVSLRFHSDKRIALFAVGGEWVTMDQAVQLAVWLLTTAQEVREAGGHEVLPAPAA